MGKAKQLVKGMKMKKLFLWPARSYGGLHRESIRRYSCAFTHQFLAITVQGLLPDVLTPQNLRLAVYRPTCS